MKHVWCFVSVSLIAAAALAQQPVTGQRRGMAQSLQAAYNSVKMNVTQSAEKMTEADYSFKPVPDVRSFGQLMGHIANAHYVFCSTAKGVPNPNQGNNFEQKTAKADLVKALADSYAFCADAYSSVTDASGGEFVKQGQNEVARGAVLAQNVAHDNESYGTAVVYLRLKGVVPPSTERANQGRGRGGE